MVLLKVIFEKEGGVVENRSSTFMGSLKTVHLVSHWIFRYTLIIGMMFRVHWNDDLLKQKFEFDKAKQRKKCNSRTDGRVSLNEPFLCFNRNDSLDEWKILILSKPLNYPLYH